MKSSAQLTDKSQNIAAQLAQFNVDILAQATHYEEELERKDKEHELALKDKESLIEQLKEALILAHNQRFAARSEKARSQQVQFELFNEAEAQVLQTYVDADEPIDTDELDDDEGFITVPEHQRRKGGRKPLPADLPRIDVIHDVAEEDKICPHDGHALTPIADKISEQLDIVPMKIKVIRHVRKQYACPCCEGMIKTATKPPQAIEKSMASAGLLAYIATAKYADALPLYRQSNILSRFGIDLDRTTMANWMIKCGKLAQPLINRLEERLLSQSYVHMDESPVQVLKEPGKTAQSKSYMWVRSAGPPGHKTILFDYDASRSGSVPQRLLADYTGALMVDGYEGYTAVCQQQSLTRLGCWAHAWRKFVEANKAQGKNKKSPQAEYAIKLIGKLYILERQLEQQRDEHPDQAAFEAMRYEQRQQRGQEIIDKLKAWLDDLIPKVAPKTALGKALHYLNNQWPRLIRYLDDGHYPIDNNRVENAIRPFAIGRKNSYDICQLFNKIIPRMTFCHSR